MGKGKNKKVSLTGIFLKWNILKMERVTWHNHMEVTRFYLILKTMTCVIWCQYSEVILPGDISLPPPLLHLTQNLCSHTPSDLKIYWYSVNLRCLVFWVIMLPLCWKPWEETISTGLTMKVQHVNKVAFVGVRLGCWEHSCCQSEF